MRDHTLKRNSTVTRVSVPAGSERWHHLVDSLDAARRQLGEKGIDVVVDEWGAVRYAYFSDPDGNSWVLQEQLKAP